MIPLSISYPRNYLVIKNKNNNNTYNITCELKLHDSKEKYCGFIIFIENEKYIYENDNNIYSNKIGGEKYIYENYEYENNNNIYPNKLELYYHYFNSSYIYRYNTKYEPHIIVIYNHCYNAKLYKIKKTNAKILFIRLYIKILNVNYNFDYIYCAYHTKIINKKKTTTVIKHLWYSDKVQYIKYIKNDKYTFINIEDSYDYVCDGEGYKEDIFIKYISPNMFKNINWYTNIRVAISHYLKNEHEKYNHVKYFSIILYFNILN